MKIAAPILRFGRATIKQIASPIVLFRYRKIRKTNRQESERRKSLTIFDYRALAAPMPYCAYHITHGMNIYGFFHSFTQYAGIKKINPRYGIEHGPYLALKGRKYADVITFGNYREELIQASQSKAIKIGPYIHYAEPLLNRHEFDAIKQQLGKVMLVFPTHSLDSLIATYNIQSFIDFIEEKKTSFDTVLVCCHWKDFSLNKSGIYEEKGYKLVTAGHPNDIYFLSRLKTIINLADRVLSNDYGTHIGYCIHLNKPVCLYSQPIQYEVGISQKDYNKEIHQRTEKEWNDIQTIKEQINKLLGSFESVIHKEQYQKLSCLFGFEHVKNKEDLKRVLK